jgi:hypothetical protein
VTYSLNINKYLRLKDLFVNLSNVDAKNFEDVRGKVINGIAPRKPKEDESFFNNIYQNINLPLLYNGRILIADEFIHNYYVHMGFHPAWKYRKVYELIFKDGLCISAHDVSDKMEEFRENIDLINIKRARESKKTIERRVFKSFYRRYSPLDTWIDEWKEEIKQADREQNEEDIKLKNYNEMIKGLFESINKNGHTCKNCGVNTRDYKLSEGLMEKQIYTSKSLIICRKCGHVIGVDFDIT